MIDLDANASTPLDPGVMAAMLPVLAEAYGNPSSVHAAGRAARAYIDSARDSLAHALGCRPHELLFTASGTESCNLAILGLVRANRDSGERRRHLITCATEHHAVLHAFDYLESREGHEVTRLRVTPDGVLDPADLAAALREDTLLVSIMGANNETGVLHPTPRISQLCKDAGALFHSDLIQSFGKEPLDLSLFDAASFSAHKFYGPKGAGLLYVRGGLPLAPIQYGGAQEGDRRPGTENAAAASGMAAAALLAVQRLEEDARNGRMLRDRLQEGLLERCPGVSVNGAASPRLWNTLSITFPASDAESLLMALDIEGVGASSGSACMVGSMRPSHVLEAMGLPSARAASTIRFSLGRSVSSGAVETAIQKVGRVWDRLRA